MGLPGRSLLEFRDARLHVCLGVGDAERAAPQEVALGVEIAFAAPPAACRSDRLDDTVCYAELIATARAIVAERSFRTVEHLAHELAHAFRKRVPAEHGLRVTVTKLRPPVANLPGGVSFSLDG